jgi:hypothetical protein
MGVPLLLSSSSCVCTCDESEGGDTAFSTAFGLGVRANISTALAAPTGAALPSWALSRASIKAEAVPMTALIEEDEEASYLIRDEEASAFVRSRDCEVDAARSRDCDVDAARSRDCEVDAARSRDCEVVRDAATDFEALSMAA